VAAVSAANPSRAHTIILDGLLGLGSKPPLRDPILAACREINRLRQERGAYVFAVDQPTGLDGDSGETDRNCVVADFTVTMAPAWSKSSFRKIFTRSPPPRPLSNRWSNR